MLAALMSDVWPVAVAILLVALTVFTLARRRAWKRPRFEKLLGVEVVSILRYAVKGLDPDSLAEVDLRRCGSRGGLPNDRRWALRYMKAPGDVIRLKIVSAPDWTHKSNFFCAFTAGKRLSHVQTHFDDVGAYLTVKDRSTKKVLLRESLENANGIEQIEHFFSEIAEQPLKLQEGTHFGNTAAGCTKGNGDLDVVHIVNMDTLRCVSERIGVDLAPSRFRPNIVLRGLAPWKEFSWVGNTICIGGSIFRVLNRTVRCAATHIDREDSQSLETDIPAILQREFPEHGPYLGVYAQFVGAHSDNSNIGAGSLRVGDGVSIEKLLH